MLWLWIKYMLISATVLSKFSFKKPKYFFSCRFYPCIIYKTFPKNKHIKYLLRQQLNSNSLIEILDKDNLNYCTKFKVGATMRYIDPSSLISHLFFRRRLFTVRNKRPVFWGSAAVTGGPLILGVGDFCLWGWGTGLLPDSVILCGFFHQSKGLLLTMAAIVSGLYWMIIVWKYNVV